MTGELGSKLVKSIDALKDRGVFVKHITEKDSDVYMIKGQNYQAEVIINPKKWIGMNFNVSEGGEGKNLTYSLDTDLYNISDLQHREFAKEIENDIASFLKLLGEKRIMKGTVNGRPSLVVPEKDGYSLIKAGRLFTSKKYIKSSRAEDLNKTLEPVS